MPVSLGTPDAEVSGPLLPLVGSVLFHLRVCAAACRRLDFCHFLPLVTHLWRSRVCCVSALRRRLAGAVGNIGEPGPVP